MPEFNFSLVLGFLIWSAVCLTMLVVTRVRSNKWKRAAHVMEVHAANLQEQINALRWERYIKRISDAKKL